MLSRRCTFWLLVVCNLVTGCATQVNLSSYAALDIDPAVTARGGTDWHLFQSLPVRSGQIIVSEAGGAVSFMMELMASQYSPYVHAGVVSVENGRAYVYEAFAQLSLQFWRPPTDRLAGKVRKVSLDAYLKRQTITAIYEPNDASLAAIVAYARGAHAAGLPFDGYFDSRSADAVYCTEFVAQALMAGGHPAVSATARTSNASLNRVMDWLELETPGFILPADLLHRADRIALLSKRYTPDQVEARFAFKHQLHHRFFDDQLIGTLFRWTPLGPKFRPHLMELHAELMEGAEGQENIEAWVAARVRDSLGPVLTSSQASLGERDQPGEESAPIRPAR